MKILFDTYWSSSGWKKDKDRIVSKEKVEPSKEDYKIFCDIIEAIKGLPNEAHARDIEKALGKVLKSNQNEREILIDILGYCGILETEERKGFFRKYINADSRGFPAVSKIDWQYPVAWWRGKNKVNTENLKDIFY